MIHPSHTLKLTETHIFQPVESTPVSLEILGAYALSNDLQYANAGDDVNLVCDYLELSGDDSPAAWTAAGVASPVATADSATQSSFAIAGLLFCFG